MPDVALLAKFLVLMEILTRAVQFAAAVGFLVASGALLLRTRRGWLVVFWLARKVEHFFEHIVAWLIKSQP